MFYELRLSAPDRPETLRREYDDALASAVESAGIEDATARTSVDRERLDTLVGGGSPRLSLDEASSLLALDETEPDAETIAVEACEHLLLGMSTAVLDVETLAAEVELDLDPKEVQQKIERRAPMTFDEFVHLQYAIADSAP